MAPTTMSLPKAFRKPLLSGHGRGSAEHQRGQSVLRHAIARPELGIALAGHERVVHQRGLEFGDVVAEAIGRGDEDGVHDTAPGEQADGVVDDEVAVLAAELHAPLEPLGGGIVVRRHRPPRRVDGGHAQALALLVVGLVRLLQGLEQRVGVELLVILDVAAVLEKEDGEPPRLPGHERVAVVPRRILGELEEAARVRGVEERLALRDLERGDGAQASVGRSPLPAELLDLAHDG